LCGRPRAGGRLIAAPDARGRDLAAFFLEVEPSLWRDLCGSGALHDSGAARARREWECFLLYACVRGLVAAGGFGDDNMLAMDALHDAVVARWEQDSAAGEPLEAIRARVAERYDEYGSIGQTHEAGGPQSVVSELGSAAARHLSGTDIADAELGVIAGELHDAVMQGATERVRRAEG
jgi:hypothetical protein